MTATRVRTVDAFTDSAFAGNPAGVVVLSRYPADAWMQALAMEMNLSETAFVVPVDEPDADFRLRWFTPVREVDICVIVTARAAGEGDYDFVSRFFAPRDGIPEDPVTGSAHTVLGPYWAERLGRNVLGGVQVSRRGGRVNVEVLGDRVILSGRAVLVIDGSLSSEATRAMA